MQKGTVSVVVVQNLEQNSPVTENHIWKYHFVPSKQSFAWALTSLACTAEAFTEIFYDTKTFSLAANDRYLKHVENHTDSTSCWKVKRVTEVESTKGRLMYEEWKGDSLADALDCINLGTQTVPFTRDQLIPKATLRVQRMKCTIGTLKITYDEVEFEDGDYYSVCSATSASICSQKDFLQTLVETHARNNSLHPSRSRFSEFLRRYEPDLFAKLVQEKKFFDHVQPLYELLPLFPGTHPNSCAMNNLRAATMRELGVDSDTLQLWENQYEKDSEK